MARKWYVCAADDEVIERSSLHVQKVSYAAAKSDTLAKLDGTYKQPALPGASAAAENLPSSVQQAIFAGPPGTTGTTAASTAPPPGLKRAADTADDASTPGAQSVKRAREESDDEKDEAPMDMDDEAMEESDSE